jgi:vacuolar-type H+-ATPase subunit I/STV1
MFAIPKHDEIIPSVFMLSTVPILFGMMFSDFGHGLILLCSSYLLNLSPFWKLMGIMSVYFGILFN